MTQNEEDEAIKAAMVIKEYCKAQKDCVDCVFFKDYPEIMEECELNRYAPLTWQLKGVKKNDRD